MSDTQNNIIRFNYSVDPTTLMSNSWITTNTDTTQNTVTGIDYSTENYRSISITTLREQTLQISVGWDNGTYNGNYIIIGGNLSSEVSEVTYNSETDILTISGSNPKGGNYDIFTCSNFSTATETTTYTETRYGTWSYENTTVSRYDHYEVELYINSDVTVFPNNLFTQDTNLTSIEFDTYSITSIEDGVVGMFISSGAFSVCNNLSFVILPNNLEYIGSYAFDDKAKFSSITIPSTLNEIGTQGLYINSNVIITSLAVEPPIIHTQSIPSNAIITIHETAIQSYINSDWADYVSSISTIETPTYNNVLKFNYSENPTTFLNNLWVNSCTDTSANTIEGKGEATIVTKQWREVSYSVLSGGVATSQGVVKIGWENDTYTGEFEVVETIEGDVVNEISYTNGTLEFLNRIPGQFAAVIMEWSDFDIAVENQEYTQSSISSSQTTSYTNTTTTIEVYPSYEVTLYINSALNTFETTMFENDTNLLTIELPDVITTITDDAFNGCTNLNTVTMYSTIPPTISTDTFTGVTATLYVPYEALDQYRSEYVGIFTDILPISIPPTPTHSYGFNLSGMKNVDYGKQGVIILRN